MPKAQELHKTNTPGYYFFVCCSLPHEIRHIQSTTAFKTTLKTICLKVIKPVTAGKLSIPSTFLVSYFSWLVCVRACVHACVHVCACMCVCVCACACMCVMLVSLFSFLWFLLLITIPVVFHSVVSQLKC